MDTQEPVKVENSGPRDSYPLTKKPPLIQIKNAKSMEDIKNALSNLDSQETGPPFIKIVKADLDALSFDDISNIGNVLIIENSKIKRVKSAAFKNVPLDKLILSNNEFLQLDAGAFDGLEKLRFLKLSCKSIPPGLLETTTELKKFNLNAPDLGSLRGVKLGNLLKIRLEHKTKVIPRCIFKNFANLESLAMFSCDIQTLSEGAFTGLRNLKSLDLLCNKIKHLPVDLFSDLVSLETLWLGENQIEELPVGLFKNCRKLETVYAHDNRVSAIPVGIFNDLPCLETVQLDTNRIVFIDDDAFKGTKLNDFTVGENLLEELFVCGSGLKEVWARQNNIKKLKKGAIRAGTTLEYLQLERNKICELEEGCLEGVELERLNMSNNELKLVANGAFKGASILQQLNLESNKIEEIEDGAFEGLQKLQRLSLSNNSIKILKDTFTGLGGLTILELQNCAIEEVHCFKTLSSLTELHLHDNKIHSIHPGAFSSLAQLKHLYLNSNAISSIKAGVFDGLASLYELDLSANTLQLVPAGLFKDLSSLRILDLSNNQIKEVDVEGLTELEILRLQSNQLENFGAAFNPVSKTLKSLNLSHNKINRVDIEESSLVDLDLSHNRIEDVYKLNRCKNLRDLFLDHNSITNLPSGVFGDLNSLETLTLDNNSLEEINSVFSNLPKLEWLSVKNNKIKKVHTDAFNNTSSLCKVHLNNNKLECFDMMQLCDKLETLNLENNRIGALDEETVTSLKKVPNVVVDGNPLDEKILQQFRSQD